MDVRASITKTKILYAALDQAIKSNYANITVNDIVRAANVAVGTFHYHFDTIHNMRDEIMTYAIRNKILEIVAQGIVSNHPFCKKLPSDFKRKALDVLAS